MKKIIVILFVGLSFNFCSAQIWVQKNSNPLTKSGRTRSSAFAINGKGYVLGGSDASGYHPGEAWAYDTLTNSWSPVMNYPDLQASNGKVAVSVDSLGYAGTGVQSFGYWSSTWYSYNPKTNMWKQLKNYPGHGGRAYACAFTINGEIYVAGGVNVDNFHEYNDFYKYDPPTDTWTRLGTCPASGVNAFAVAFSINGYGYVGLGEHMDSVAHTQTPESDFWRYDPINNSWQQMTSYPGRKILSNRQGVRGEAIGWATCNKGYVGGGYDSAGVAKGIDSTFYSYDPIKDKWTQIASYGAGNINGAAVFTIGKTAYVNGGQRDSANYFPNNGFIWVNSIWAYTQTVVPTFTTANAQPTTVCANQSITFNDTSNFAPTDWKWHFFGGTPDTSTSQNPIIAYDSVGTFSITITAWNGCDSATKTYTNYITVDSAIKVSVLPVSPSACNGQSITLKASGGTTYQWVGTTDTTDSLVISPKNDTTYELRVGNGACITDTFITVKSGTALPLDIEPQGYALCSGSSVALYVVGGGANFIWTPATGLSSSTGDTVVVNPTIDVTYTVNGTTTAGCTSSGTDEISVVPAPNKPIVSRVGDVLTSSATQGNQWERNDSTLQGSTDQSYTVAVAGCYSVTIINPANGCSATSDTSCVTPTGINQLSINSDQLSIYPNPSTGLVFITINTSVQDIKDWSLKVTDVLGRTLLTRESLNYNNELDLSGLSNSIYFITISNKTGRAVFPLVKQN